MALCFGKEFIIEQNEMSGSGDVTQNQGCKLYFFAC